MRFLTTIVLPIPHPHLSLLFLSLPMQLDYKVDEKKLKEVFKIAGKLVSVDLATDKDGNSRGFGVVEYEHPVEAVQAISMLDRQLLFERRMTVRLDRVPDKNEAIKLPEGLASIGIGLGPNGEPLRNVAINLFQMQQQNSGNNNNNGGNNQNNNNNMNNQNQGNNMFNNNMMANQQQQQQQLVNNQMGNHVQGLGLGLGNLSGLDLSNLNAANLANLSGGLGGGLGVGLGGALGMGNNMLGLAANPAPVPVAAPLNNGPSSIMGPVPGSGMGNNMAALNSVVGLGGLNSLPNPLLASASASLHSLGLNMNNQMSDLGSNQSGYNVSQQQQQQQQQKMQQQQQNQQQKSSNNQYSSNNFGGGSAFNNDFNSNSVRNYNTSTNDYNNQQSPQQNQNQNQQMGGGGGGSGQSNQGGGGGGRSGGSDTIVIRNVSHKQNIEFLFNCN